MLQNAITSAFGLIWPYSKGDLNHEAFAVYMRVCVYVGVCVWACMCACNYVRLYAYVHACVCMCGD